MRMKKEDELIEDPDIEKLNKYVDNFYWKDNSPTWENFVTINSCYPEHEREAEHLIRIALGYLPSIRVYADYLPFLKTIVHQEKIGQLIDKNYYDEFTTIVKQIRNHQMKVENRLREYEIGDFEDYFRIGKKFKHEARKLLWDMLGFETKNIHSLDAELIIRRDMMISKDPDYSDYSATAYLAATIALYRYNFIEHGEAAANETPLLGFYIPKNRKLAQA